MKVIGLTGVARSGKDTVAGLIVDELRECGLDTRREGFADRLKLSAALALGLPVKGEGADAVVSAVASCDALKVCGSIQTLIEHGPYDVQEVTVNGREYLQRYGTEAHRDLFGDDFWVDALLPLQRRSIGHGGVIADPARDDCDVLVIPDVRFDNEARRVLKYEGEVWRVTRPGVDAVNAHASESGIPDDLVTREVGNIGGLGYLRGVVRYAIREARVA